MGCSAWAVRGEGRTASTGARDGLWQTGVAWRRVLPKGLTSPDLFLRSCGPWGLWGLVKLSRRGVTSRWRGVIRCLPLLQLVP